MKDGNRNAAVNWANRGKGGGEIVEKHVENTEMLRLVREAVEKEIETSVNDEPEIVRAHEKVAKPYGGGR